MTKEEIRDALLHTAAKYRWAFEELVYDEHMKAANRLYGGPRREQRAYLSGRGVDWAGGKGRPDGFMELVYDEKEKEAVELFSSLRGMVGFLRSCYGSRAVILKALRHLIAIQAERRKTCHFQKK